jgi:hypothetical protein
MISVSCHPVQRRESQAQHRRSVGRRQGLPRHEAVRLGGRPLGSAMRYPPHREIESRHPPAPRRGALAIHLVHVYRAQEPCAPSIIRPLLNRKLYAVPGVFQCRESCRTVRVDGKAAAWYGWRGEGRSDVVVKRSTEQHNEAHLACDEQGCRTPYLYAC